MKTMMILLLAAVPPAAIWAQTRTPTAQSANTQPGQGEAKQGANLCGHVIDAGTFLDARAQNATHEEALVMRWLDPRGTAVHSSLFMGRCVARDGDTIDSKLIVRVLPNSLAVSDRHGLTAWEAEYWDSPAEKGGRSTPHRGVFNENRFVTELDPSRVSEAGSVSDADPDFRWNEEAETIAVKPGIVLVSPSPRYAFQATSTPCVAAPPKQTGLLGTLTKHVKHTLEIQAGKADTQIAKDTGGSVDGGLKDATTTAANEANQPQPCTPTAKGQPAKQ
jgi:hypothetical protein